MDWRVLFCAAVSDVCQARDHGSWGSRPRNIAFGDPLFAGLSEIIVKAPGHDGCARARHQVLVVEKIDDGEERAAKRLPAAEQMMQISARKVPRRRAAAFRIERPRVVG